MKRKKQRKPYWEMNLQELREATKEFDGPIDLSQTRAMTKAERAGWERTRRQPSRSIFLSRPTTRGKSCQLCVEIDPKLLSRCAKYASSHNMSIAELIARSLQSSLSFVA